MAEALVQTYVAVAIVSLLSLIGALALSFRALNRHGVMLGLVAVAAGTLLGDVFLHILPEAVSASDGFTARLGTLALAGFIIMFVLEVALRWRHSHAEHVDNPHHPHSPALDVQPFGWLNLVGDALHNLLDGVVIAAAFLVDVGLGWATAVAVAIHEIPQELGDFAVLVRSGMAAKRALLLNLGSALFAVVGASAVLALDLSVHTLETIALPLIAGAFVYIAAADLVPELHHHSKGADAVLILMAFLVGVAIMVGLLSAEEVLFASEAGHDH